MLGLFDSGLGGLTVLRRVRERLPLHDAVYLADQAHVPYGERAFGDLHALLRHNLDYLNDAGARAIVVACNTSCAAAAEYGWPPSAAPVLDLIETAAASLAAGGARRIGVIATSATIRSGAYGLRLRDRIPGAHVEEVAAPALVPLVEAGAIEGEGTREAVRDACAPFSRDLDAVVLACTHYPVLDAHFAAVLGEGTVRVDPAVAQAEATVLLAAELGIGPGSGTVRYATTGALEPFVGSVRTLMNEPDPLAVAAHEILTR